MLVISSLIIGCVDAPKVLGITKSQPCVIQTSISGNVVGTISSGDCSEAQKRGFSNEEQKLIGTWSIKTQVIDKSYIFNSDKTGFMTTQAGNTYFKWEAVNGIIYVDNRFIDPRGSMKYKLINNDKTLVIDGALSFEKSWW